MAGISVKQLDKINEKLWLIHTANNRIKQLKAETEELRKQCAEYEEEVGEFAMSYQDEIGEELRLANGKIGFRAPKRPALELLKNWTWDKVIARLHELQLSDYVRVKEEPNKEKLRSDFTVATELKRLGMELDSSPKFYIETYEAVS